MSVGVVGPLWACSCCFVQGSAIPHQNPDFWPRFMALSLLFRSTVLLLSTYADVTCMNFSHHCHPFPCFAIEAITTCTARRTWLCV